MAAGTLVLAQYMPARDRSGRLVSGARLTVYLNRTTTKATVYADAALTTPLANPVVANASGQFPSIWTEAGTADAPVLYTLAVSGPNGESIGNPSTFDDFQPSLDADTINVLLSTKAEKDLSDVPAADFGGKAFTAAPAGLAEPVVRSMSDRLTTELFVAGQDFSLAVNGSTDDQPTLQALSDYARTNSRAIKVLLPTKGFIGLGAALSINSDYVEFMAGGAGYSHDATSPAPLGFVPVNGYTGTALFHGSPAGPNNPVIVGGGFKNLSVLGLFSRALRVRSVQSFDTELYFGPVSGTEAVLLDCLVDYRAGSAYSQLGESGDNQLFRLRLRGRLTSEGGGNSGAHGLVYSGFASASGHAAASGNTSVSHDTDINIRTDTGHAFVCENADEVTVNIRHQATGTGRPAYIKGNRTNFSAPGFGLGTGVNLWYTSANAAYYEGTDTPANDTAASGKVALDRGNNTPYPLFGTGAKPLVIDPEAIVGAWLRSPVMASDAFTIGAVVAAMGGAGAGVGDSGAGALLMRLVSGGLLRWGEQSATTARMLAGGGIDKLVMQGLTKGLQVDRIETVNGGLRSTPYEGWAGALANGEMITDIVDGPSPSMRFQFRRPNGTLTLATINLSPV